MAASNGWSFFTQRYYLACGAWLSKSVKGIRLSVAVKTAMKCTLNRILLTEYP